MLVHGIGVNLYGLKAMWVVAGKFKGMLALLHQGVRRATQMGLNHDSEGGLALNYGESSEGIPNTLKMPHFASNTVSHDQNCPYSYQTMSLRTRN